MKLIDWCKNNGDFGTRVARQYTGITETGEYYDITEMTHGRRIKLLWECNTCGHKWFASVASVVFNKAGCPICYNLKFKESLADWADSNGEYGKQLLEGIDLEGMDAGQTSCKSARKFKFTCAVCGEV